MTAKNRAAGGCEPNDPLKGDVGGNQLGYIALTYTDMFGSRYTTRPILIDSTRESTQDADAALPANQFAGTMMADYKTCTNDADCRGDSERNVAMTATAAVTSGVDCNA